MNEHREEKHLEESVRKNLFAMQDTGYKAFHEKLVPTVDDAGADDVLTAPFLMGELLARVRALGRRGPMLQPRLLSAGDLTLDRGHCMLQSREGQVRLSGKEMQIIELFLLHPGQVLSRTTLQQKVWGVDNEFAYNNIEVYLSLVRRKLRAIGSEVAIHAERGVGYYLET